MRRLFRMALAGAKLFWGELRKGPRAALRLIGDGFAALFGRKGALDRYRDSAAVREVRKAATERRWAAERRARLAGRGMRKRESIMLQLGLGLLRQGRVIDAGEIIDSALEKFPDSDRLLAARASIAGERIVLSGNWDPRPEAGEIAPIGGRVLHVVGKSLPHVIAGYTVRTQSVAVAQQSAGLDPVVVTKLGFPAIEGIEDVGPSEKVADIRYRHVGDADVPTRWDERLTANLQSLYQVIEEEQPAVLHAHSDFENAVLALQLRRRYDIPVVYEVRGFWEETWLSKGADRSTRSERYRWRRERELQSMREADLVVTLAPTMLERMIEDGIDPERVVVIPNAVDPSRFPAFEGRDQQVAAELGVADADIVLGYISSLVGYEGIDTLIDAVAILRKGRRDVRAVIVGDGEERVALERHAARAGVADFVVFTGRVPFDTVDRFYRALDIFVVPRRNDQVCRLVTPLKPFEALSLGRPLVVSDVPALAGIVDESQAGATFRAENPSDLAAVIDRLAADPLALAELGRTGAAWVRGHRTWDANGRRYVEAFSEHGLI